MTNYIILALCVIVILSYIFDISSKFSKIPGVILLIALGMGIQLVSASTGFSIPNIRPLLPVMGTLGLIMIVMEASLDIEISRKKKVLFFKSILSALILFGVFIVVMTFVLVKYMDFSFRDSLLNSIPLGIISSSIAIPAASSLRKSDKEFVVYESSFSDIIGIMLFDFILLSQSSFGIGVFKFVRDGFITVIIALISSAGLAYLLHKTRYHINYVIILTSIILIYSLAKLVHLPALLMILIFGLALANNKFLEIDFVKKFVDFPKFRKDISSFKNILGELTFLVRSFFFIMFGYYTEVLNLFNYKNILTALIICAGLYITRWLFFKLVIRMPTVPMVLFAPRGLITILLFLSIPLGSKLSVIPDEVVTLVILITIFVMAIGNIIQKGEMPVTEVNSANGNMEKVDEI
ncbi:MAG: sodium:proton antiporter [Bacteroidia bacterium]|nr:MAG: sodium:proton antiporter [Bacteroidia bacterium]